MTHPHQEKKKQLMNISDAHKKADPKTFYFAKDQKQLVDRYDQAAEVYDEAMDDDVGWTGHMALAAVIARYLSPRTHLLDAGAGTGMLGDKLVEHGFDNMDANDLSPGMLNRARRKGIYKDCQVMELGAALGYPDNYYEAVAACGVFTPNHAPASALEELVRITQPQGLILYTLRADETPPGFADKHQQLLDRNAWALVETCEPFASIASEPHIRHACWVFRVL